ncbi:MAG: cytochrome C [Pseudomonadota bacterium]
MKSIIVSMVAAAGLMIVGSAMATDMPEIAKKNGCTACHLIDKKLVGPAWMDVSKKYKGAKTYKFSPTGSDSADAKEMPLVDGLMMKVSKGGKGNWTAVTGGVAMTPNDPAGTKQADIKELVHFVLALDK